MTTMKAHYDGKVFVPDEPVPVPAGTAVDVSVPTERESAKTLRASLRKELLSLCLTLRGGIGTRTWTREDLYDRRNR